MDNKNAIHPGVKLRHIRAFLDIAAEGNLSAVARAQGITQPALSRTLAELETLLGQPMFLRQGRRMHLSEAGALFRRHASIALQALEAGAAALQPGNHGTLRIGVLPTVATRVLPQIALRLRELHPDVTLSAETGPHFHLMRLLREGSVDLVIGRLPGSAEIAGMNFEHLYEEEVILVARAGHPGLGRPTAKVLAEMPAILPPVTALIRPAVDDYLAANGLSGLRPAIETVSLALGRGICLASDAVWFISRGVVIHELERGDLVELPTGARFLSGAVGMTQRQSWSAPGLDDFQQIARDIARVRE
ncbi:LysR substrate-binding domain-containing protein [Paracoccus shanxieyensis]|uniref:LysR family transcriptional regulator n=1 Tax=Paracoccus shanxieyensis TaxID=2675752 RepID=A0A6L6IYD5_9RHOB|nr:LysR substrate-binding domain-containing protein [Paracoccus shanxieyensis]MTH65525.1 LysR family transcriptional regulator [Paracoccus shanxieyensis]MTH88679.1 LysR family transcriptional regulator [Paracoccus shanxieyensis]